LINKVEICGVNTAKLPVLSNEEKNALLMEIKEGNQEAREKFINGNLKLVLSVIKRFYGRGENLDDLFQIGCIGLIKAMDNFDLEQNVQFSTYAVPMIVGEIRRYLRDNNMVRVSRSVRDLAYKVLAIKEKALREKQKELTVEEVAKELGVEKEEIAFCLDAIQEPMSLQEPVYGDDTENIYVEDQIRDKKNSDENWADDITIAETMKKLKEKERNIINKRFFEGRTQMEVAEEIGISQAQVSRLEKSAIDHIKRLYN
jgi:RNA polymerase sigma-G factor